LAAEDATASKPAQQSASDVLDTRVYHPHHIAKNDLQRMIEPLLSERGKIDNPQADADLIVVYDHEAVLKAIDRLVVKLDVQPPQVLIEAMIVQVKSDKNSKTRVGSSILDRITTVHIVGGNSAEIIRTLTTLGEVKVLACPRLLVLDKQRAEIHLGGEKVDQTADHNQATSSQVAKPSGIETYLRLRPFISSDGMIRLEARVNCSVTNRNPTGGDTTTTQELTTNVMIQSGTTVAVSGFTDHEVAADTKAVAPEQFRVLTQLFSHWWYGTDGEEWMSEDSTTRKELLVILTPRIWRPTAPATAEVRQSGDFAFKK
jgi:type II secretory pathway component GspD/PulD (secretin)